jgi:hypothetical protein
MLPTRTGRCKDHNSFACGTRAIAASGGEHYWASWTSGRIIYRVAETLMIRKLKSGAFRLYSRKVDPKTGRRRNLGTFRTRAKAEKHERAVQFFKRHG